MGMVHAKSDQKVYQQVGGTCYAHAIAEALFSTQSRIIGRKPETHQQIVRRLVNIYGDDGANTYSVLKIQCLKKYLRCEYITESEAESAVRSGRVVIATFSLSDQGWRKFSQQAADIQYLINKLQKGKQGHAAAIVGMEDGKQGKTKYWLIKNAWGESFSDKGYFKVQMYTIKMSFIDVYFLQSDLSQQGKLNYKASLARDFCFFYPFVGSQVRYKSLGQVMQDRRVMNKNNNILY